MNYAIPSPKERLARLEKHVEKQDWRWLTRTASGRCWSPNRREMRKILESHYVDIPTVSSVDEADSLSRQLALKGVGEFGAALKKRLATEKIPSHKAVIKELRCAFR
jgi:hypothetical protein